MFLGTEKDNTSGILGSGGKFLGMGASKQLSSTYYNGIVKAWIRKTKSEKDKELITATEFIDSISV